MNQSPVQLNEWARDIIVDPLSKQRLTVDDKNTLLISNYGRNYPIINGIFDLRLLANVTTADQRRWREGQYEYERSSESIASQDQTQDYVGEVEGVRQIYQEMPIEGSCLDVGGHQGRLRQFLSTTEHYITCDTFLNVFNNLQKQPNLIRVYPFLVKPVNFVCCDAEFLPFRSNSFDTVHMRSVIDHFLSPELALNEAYRVLVNEGALIVGSFVRGGRSGKSDIKSLTKRWIREALVALGMNRFRDYHVWHPTYKQLINLISQSGFVVEKVHWQKGFNNTVCYILARKRLGLTRCLLKSPVTARIVPIN